MLVLLHWIEECLFATHQAICWSECLDVEMLILHTKRFESWRQDSLYLQHLYSYGKSTRSFAIFCGPARANSQARLAIVGLASKKTSLTKLEKYSKILHSHRRRRLSFFSGSLFCSFSYVKLTFLHLGIPINKLPDVLQTSAPRFSEAKQAQKMVWTIRT